MARKLETSVERFAIAGTFTIARGSRTEAVVVRATILDDGVRGRGECTPYARYGESVDSVEALIASVSGAIEAGASREELAQLLPAGAARNALDCALWDLDAKRSGIPVHVSAGLDRLGPVTTAYTISLGAPAAMAASAQAAAHRPILKIKLGGPTGDPERIAAVRAAAPDSTLIVDANEGWTPATLEANLAACAACGVELIEQPVPAAETACLAEVTHTVPICADESVHDRHGLAELVGRFDAINIKLDKTGGLTEALALAAEGERLGLAIMVGCMLGSSLAMAPALLLAPRARFVDLDAPLLLARDEPGGLTYDGSIVRPADRALWG